jgi:photosystem II stability/assembly factor-like uncharacterized protein
MRIVIAIRCAASLAAAAFGLPAELVAISKKEVRPNEAAGLYYLGRAAGGYLYNGSAAALGRVAPYHVLGREATSRDYYLVWLPRKDASRAAAALEGIGTAVRLSASEMLVGLPARRTVGEIWAAAPRASFARMMPVTPATWEYDGEPPPTEKDPVIENAVNSITQAEYAGYIQTLQNFGTRCTDTAGNADATNYVKNFFGNQNLSSSVFEYRSISVDDATYASAGGRIYLLTDRATLKRSVNAGAAWTTIYGTGTRGLVSMFWRDGTNGFLGAYNNTIAKTANGGNTWTPIQYRPGYPDTRYYPYGMHFVNANVGWLGGRIYSGATNTGFILKTANGGSSWTAQTVPSTFMAVGFDFYDANRGWAFSDGSNSSDKAIRYTGNGGATWQECTLPMVLTINDVAAVGPAEAWACDRGIGRILHTTDGLNWSFVDPGVEGDYWLVEFPTASRGFAAGTKVITTANGGASWTELTAAPALSYDVMSFVDASRGVLGNGYNGEIYRTADAGGSFAKISDNVDLTAEDVIGEKPGTEAPDEIIVIGGHYDDISDLYPSVCPGAEDNASGSVCALAAARALKNVPFKRTVRYVVFGDEEYGLYGSHYYANYLAGRNEKVVAMLNADMVSFDEEKGQRDDFSIAYGSYPWLFDYLKGVGQLYGNNLIYDHEEFTGSDHASFWNAGYAAIGAIEGEVGEGGVLDYPYYHTTRDTLDKLQPAIGVRLCRDFAATLAHLARSPNVGVEEPFAPRGPGVPTPMAFAVYPNPYRYAAAATGIRFTGVSAPATVELFDLSGRRVARDEVKAGEDELVWRPATAAGEPLAPGVYLYRVTGRDQLKRGKLVVAE